MTTALALPVRSVLLAAALLLAAPALAQDPNGGAVVTPDPDGKGAMVSPATPTDRQLPKDPSKASSVRLNFPVDSSLLTWVKFFADLKRLNFIIPDIKEIENKKVTIISNQDVTPDAAWEAFLSALQVNGYTLSVTGNTAKIVKLGSTSSVGRGIPRDSDAYVTQLITLENTRVDDMSKIISNMAGPESKIVSYPPTNTLIISDTAANIRKIYQVMKELDVASPKSTMEIYQLQYATASDVKAIIEQLYKVEDQEEAQSSSRTTRTTRRTSRTSRRPEPASETVSAGDETKFIAQVIDDDRTNSLIVLANEDGHQAVRDLVARLDVDVSQEGEIHVVNLEHAKAEEVANVLAQLSQNGSTSQSRRNGTNTRTSAATRTTPARAASGAAPEGGPDEGGGALAAFDSGMRIAPDEATNSLVIIADREDFVIVKRVIDQLDVERKQVFVDAVILELSSQDTYDFGLAAHLPQSPGKDQAGFIGAQLGASSLGLSTDALTGLAVGVFGQPISVPLSGLEAASSGVSSIEVPAFGIALNALKSSGATNIVSNPSLTTLDNEEASIVVGRKVPFPTASGFNSLGQQTFSFQREDVAITLTMTPRINSSNYVTLELEIEVQEVEDSAQSSAVASAGGGFITSQRKVETVALVSDNQTMVIGGLVGTTEGSSESKIPVLGDIPVLGALFRSHSDTSRKTNLMVFLTPHIVDEPDDMVEIQRVKEAQRQEFLRRFYGKSRSEFFDELKNLLQYSMNFVDEPTMYRGPTVLGRDLRLDEQTRAAFQEAVEDSRNGELGEGAGELPEDHQIEIDDGAPAPAPQPE
ncbi:MAG: type II secretion system secretin GspD [Myxococcota bacterium]